MRKKFVVGDSGTGEALENELSLMSYFVGNVFAVPVGASLNKNAFCLSLAVITLTAANMYGVNLSWLQPATLGTMIIIIAPGTTWAPVIALSALFEHIGCPLSSIGVVLAIYPLLDMADTVTTCNGTIASTLMTARMCGLLDTGEYSRP